MSFTEWEQRSAEMAESYPGGYLQHFPDLLMDDKTVVVTPKDYAQIMRLPVYDATFPTGVYLNKMWLEHGHLRTYEPDPQDPDNKAIARRRKILVAE